jgi:DNA-binding transcriptional ArsR family regulator
MPRTSLDATFAALADPTRRAILARLAQGERPVMELAAPFRISAPAITRHLKVLERAGLITRSREAQRRPCRLNAAPLQQAADWVALYRQHWEQGFDRLEAYLGKMAPPAPRTRTSGRKAAPMDNDRIKKKGKRP